MKPKQVVIFGKIFSIEYLNALSEVDSGGAALLLGQIEYKNSTIRIFDGGRDEGEILHTLLHEVLHGICDNLRLGYLNSDEGHDELDLLSLGLADTLARNGWLAE